MNMNSYSCCGIASEKPQQIQSLSSLLKIIAEESRLRLLCILNDGGEHCVCELADHTPDLSQSLISHHLKDLKKSDIVSCEKRGLKVFYRLTPKGERIVKLIMSLTNKENGMCNNEDKKCCSINKSKNEDQQAKSSEECCNHTKKDDDNAQTSCGSKNCKKQ